MQEFILHNGSLLAYGILGGFGLFLLSTSFYLLKCWTLSSYIEQYRRFGKVMDNRLIGKLEYITKPLPDAQTNHLLFQAAKIREQVNSVRTLRKFYATGLIIFGILLPLLIVGKFLFS